LILFVEFLGVGRLLYKLLSFCFIYYILYYIIMPSVSVYNQNGELVKHQKLNDKIFSCNPQVEIIHQVVVLSLANKRHAFAHTLKKGDVRGGGKKPWRQKGTGRARAGSIRSPLWRGGGVVFGPNKERNYSKKINKKIRKKALYMCLSDKVREKRLCILDKIELPEIKTKKFIDILNKLIPWENKKILLVLADNDKNVVKSARNIDKLSLTPVESLNVLNLLKADYLITTVKGIEKIEKHYI